MANQGFTDVCSNIDQVFNDAQQLNINATSQLDSLVSCSNSKGLGVIEDLANEAIAKATNASCSAIGQLCSDPKAGCEYNYNGSNCTVGNLESLPNMTMKDYQLGCRSNLTSQCTNLTNCSPDHQCTYAEHNTTVGECAVSCINSQQRELANETIYSQDLLFKYESIVQNDIGPILNCTYVKSAIDSLHGALCQTLDAAVLTIAYSSGILGVLLMPGTIALILGFKRFANPKGGDVGMPDIPVS